MVTICALSEIVTLSMSGNGIPILSAIPPIIFTAFAITFSKISSILKSKYTREYLGLISYNCRLNFDKCST